MMMPMKRNTVLIHHLHQLVRAVVKITNQVQYKTMTQLSMINHAYLRSLQTVDISFSLLSPYIALIVEHIKIYSTYN